MNKYEEALESLLKIAERRSEYFLKDSPTDTANVNTCKEACEKAQAYDDKQERLREEMQMIYNAQIVKTHTAEEIIEMIDAMCVDENADVIWQSGAYIRNKYIAQKVKERYGIK